MTYWCEMPYESYHAGEYLVQVVVTEAKTDQMLYEIATSWIVHCPSNDYGEFPRASFLASSLGYEKLVASLT